MSHPARTRPSRLLLALLTLAVSLGGLTLVAPAQAATVAGLEGVGTSADPVRIGSADDLAAAATAINSDVDSFGSLHYRLESDIDLAGAAFAGIHLFRGVFDGNGHTVSDAALEAHVEGSVTRTAFFGSLESATVQNLTLHGVTARMSEAAAGGATNVVAAGLAATATSSRIEGVTLRDVTVRNEVAGGTQYVAGLVGRVSGTAEVPSVITDNAVLGAHTVYTATKYSSAFLGYLGAHTTVSRNLIAADPDSGNMSQNAAGGAYMNSSTLVNYVGASLDGQTISDNVVLSGSVHSHATGTRGNTVSWIAGVNHDQAEEYGTNLVNSDHNRAGFPTVAETAADGHLLRWTRRAGNYGHDALGGELWVLGNDGTAATPTELRDRATYEALGWDFEEVWRWDARADHPVPQSAPTLTAELTSLVLSSGPALAESEVLEQLGVAVDHGTPSVDLSGVDFGAGGTYPIVVRVESGRFSASLDLEIVVTNRPIITVESDTTSYKVGSNPTTADLLTRFGATVDRGSLAIDLSGVDFDTVGSYTASVTANDGAETALAVPVTIAITPLAGLGTAAAPYLLDSVPDLEAAVALVNADTAQAGAAAAHYRLTADLDHTGAEFTSFRRFAGVFDGNGHTISNLVLRPGSETDANDSNATQTGFVEILTGTITDLTLVNLTAATNGGTGDRIQLGGFAGRIAGATLTGSALINAAVRSPDNTDNSSAVGGLVGKSVGAGNTISTNLLAGVTVNGDKRVGGIIGWQNAAATVSDNLVLDTSVTQNGSSGAGAGLITGHTVFAGELTGNVVLSGAITQSAPSNFGWIRSANGGTSQDNLVNANNNIDAAAPVGHTSAPNPNPYAVFWSGSSTLDTSGQWTVGDLGTYVAGDELAQRATYADLGWDFDDRWTWDAERAHPVPVGVDFPSVPVTVDLAGGTDDGANVTQQAHATTTVLVEPARAGYTFAGWSGDGIDGTARSVTLPRYPTGPLSYTATWAPINYAITYDLTGGSATGNPVAYTVESAEFTLANPTREGYTFVGWRGTDIADTDATVVVPTGSTGERSYTAVWTADSYPVSYDLAGGTATGDNPASYGVESPAFTLANPTRPGYVFDGWTGTGIDWTDTSVSVPAGSTGPRAYTAHWTPVTYHLVYRLGDDAGFAGDAPGEYTIESPTFTLPTPVRPGHEFAGWTGADLDGPTFEIVIAEGSTGTRVYTPTWTVRTYTISYRLGGGTVSAANPTTYTVESAPITLHNPTRPGYTFAGWAGAGATSNALQLPAGTTGDLTLTALWQKAAKAKPNVAISYLKKAKRKSGHTKVKVTVKRVKGLPAATGKVRLKVTGKVTVNGKTKRVTKKVTKKVKAGTVRIKIPRGGLTRGKYKVTATYLGNAFHKKASSRALTFNYKK